MATVPEKQVPHVRAAMHMQKQNSFHSGLGSLAAEGGLVYKSQRESKWGMRTIVKTAFVLKKAQRE